MKKIILLFLFLLIQIFKMAAQSPSDDSIIVFIDGPSVVYSGGSYKAEISLVSLQNRIPVSIFVSGTEISIENGKGVFEVSAFRLGLHKFNVSVQIKDSATGKIKSYRAEASYTVELPVANISAEVSNIMYIGIENSIAISYPGMTANDLKVTCDNGELTNKDGNYTVKVYKGRSDIATIKVVVKSEGGPDRIFTKEFRIRPLSPPTVILNNRDGGSITKEEISKWVFIYAEFNTAMAYHITVYTIQSYHCFIQSNGEIKKYKVSGPKISHELRTALLNCKKGDIIAFYNLQATSPMANKADIQSGPIFFVE